MVKDLVHDFPSVPCSLASGQPLMQSLKGSKLTSEVWGDQKTAKHCTKSFRRRQSRIRAAVEADKSLTSFPSTYGEVVRQAAESTQAAIQDGCKLIEVEFPPVSLASVAGDGEGANEMTYSMQFLRQFCRPFQHGAATTRVFFPDKKEMQVAMSGAGKNPAAGSWDVNPVFDVTKFQLDYLTTPSGLLDIGIDFNKVDVASRCKPSDQLYIIAYPHFNVNELIAVQELHSRVAEAGGQPIVVFNGELDRIRSGYYPALFFPKLGKLARTFLPEFEAAYYIHNFKGTKGGALFRAYPGPWQVYRRLPNMEMVRVQTQEEMPTLKQVALDILPAT